jgi:hypothetical protein
MCADRPGLISVEFIWLCALQILGVIPEVSNLQASYFLDLNWTGVKWHLFLLRNFKLGATIFGPRFFAIACYSRLFLAKAGDLYALGFDSILPQNFANGIGAHFTEDHVVFVAAARIAMSSDHDF